MHLPTLRNLTLSLILVAGSIIAGSCSGTGNQPLRMELDGGEAESDAVIAAHERFRSALESSDVRSALSLLDPSAELLIFHPRVVSRFDDVSEVEQGLQRMFARLGDTEWTQVHAGVSIRGEVAWITSHLVLEAANLDDPVLARATEIWVQGPDGWKLIHGHWSEER